MIRFSKEKVLLLHQILAEATGGDTTKLQSGRNCATLRNGRFPFREVDDMKKILCLLLACVLLAGLCACGASPAPAAQPAAETPAPEELAYQEAEKLLFVEPDHDLAFSRLTEWSDTEYAPLQALIGECYWQGYGTEVDYEKAFDYFSRAAEQGNLPGLYGVAMSTFFGSGVPADKIRGTDLLLEVMELSLAAAEETEDPLEKGRLYYQYAYPKLFFITYIL